MFKTLGEDEVALIRHQYLKYDEMRRTTTGVSEVNAEAHKVAQHVPRLVAHIYALEAEIERLRLALGEASRQVDFMPEEVADFLRGDTDDVEW